MSIRITSFMPHALSVPLPAPQGRKPTRFFTIPAATPAVHQTATAPGQESKPNVVEIPELDAVTIARLKHHYESRPVDMSKPDGERLHIGLLKIEVLDEDGRVATPVQRPRPRRPSGGSPSGKSAA